MRRLKFSLAIAAVTFLVGLYVNYVLLTDYGFISLIPLAMIAYVAALLYLNAKAKPCGRGSGGDTTPTSLPPHCAPVMKFASGLGLLFGGVFLLALLFGIVLLLSGGHVE